jgi:hypothetical protein
MYYNIYDHAFQMVSSLSSHRSRYFLSLVPTVACAHTFCIWPVDKLGKRPSSLKRARAVAAVDMQGCEYPYYITDGRQGRETIM